MAAISIARRLSPVRGRQTVGKRRSGSGPNWRSDPTAQRDAVAERPYKLTAQVIRSVAGLIASGQFGRKAVCKLAGITSATYDNWKRRGQTGASGLYREFYLLVSRAKECDLTELGGDPSTGNTETLPSAQPRSPQGWLALGETASLATARGLEALHLPEVAVQGLRDRGIRALDDLASLPICGAARIHGAGLLGREDWAEVIKHSVQYGPELKPGEARGRSGDAESGSLARLELSKRAYNCLRHRSIDSLGDLCCCTVAELATIRQFGIGSLLEVLTRVDGLLFRDVPASTDPALARDKAVDVADCGRQR